MIPARVEIELDKQAIKEYIHKQLDQEIRETLWFVDVDKLCQLTCMSKRYLEQEILSDVRMRAIERRKERKRWYPAKQAQEVIEEITLDW
ncbi:hypothetical protein [Sporosarcina sp. FSL W7-1283]|uniref:hypothetical protein n=1 Tax=Sporosarcina sp. FSL W7-1283 TaxID=2921560 RepID=UPI0030F87145